MQSTIGYDCSRWCANCKKHTAHRIEVNVVNGQEISLYYCENCPSPDDLEQQYLETPRSVE